MEIWIHSADLSRMAKVLVGFADHRSATNSNVEILHEDGVLKMRATNSLQFCEMSVALPGGDGEKLCVDAKMLNSVAGNQGNRMVQITGDGRMCTVKGNGRTRMTAVKIDLPVPPDVKGDSVIVKAEDLRRALDNVLYAVCANETRIELTGVHVKSNCGKLVLTALDGFQMAREYADCDGGEIDGIVPPIILKTICSACGGENVTLKMGNGRIAASADGIMISGTLLSGNYPDVARLIPQQYSCEVLVQAGAVIDAIKASSVVEDKNFAIRLKIEKDVMHMSSQGNSADFDAEIPCEVMGDGLEIAFASNYLQNTMKYLRGDDAIMKFSSAVGPMVACAKDDDGVHLTLPVRVR